MPLSAPNTKRYYDRASQVIPYGVSSNFRYWGPDDTLVIERGEGTYLWDFDGNRYIDYRLGFGPVILGHGYEEVVEQVNEAMRKGTVFAWQTEKEIEAAERIVRMCPSVDMVRFANSGTEATMHALRIARAYTSREKFIKFEGCYHGMHDYVLFSTASANLGGIGPRRSPTNMVMSAGIPRDIGQYVFNLPFNDFEMLEKTIKEHWFELAAVLVEPMLGNAAGIMPQPGFLERIRALCDEHGIVMIMDEVKTGFRIAKGGAAELFGVHGDLSTFAKSMGNGFPVAAIGGKREIMMSIEPGRVAQGGTYVANGVAVAAAAATLAILEREPIHETINQRGRGLMSGIGEILSDLGIPHCVLGVPSMFGIMLGTEEAPTDFRGYLTGDGDLYEEIVMEMAQGGGPLPDADGREPWFLCYTLSDADVADTLERFEGAVKAVAG